MSDVSLTIGATTKLFNLAVNEGAKQLSVREEPIVPIKSLSDVPSYGDLPPEKLLAFVQNNWRGGMGQKDRFVIQDMYSDGQNIDTREPNSIALGPLITTIGAVADTIIGFEFFDEQEYAISSTKVYRLNVAGDTWDTVLTIADDTIECIKVYNNSIYVGLTTGKYYFSDTGDSGDWVQSELANAIAHKLDIAPPFSGTKDLAVLATRPNEVRTSLSPGANVSVIKDYYNTGASNLNQAYGANWLAQTFTPASTYIIGSVVLDLDKIGSPGTVTVSIKAVDGSSHPTGADLCSGTTDGNAVSGWTTITFTSGVVLQSGTKYAIVVRAPSGDGSNYLWWWSDDTSPTYAGGAFEISTDSGSSWATSSTKDFMFETWSIDSAGANWIDPPYYIGDTTTNITGLMVLSGQLLVGKDDGLYLLSTEGRPQPLLPEYRTRRSSDNLKYYANWQSSLYASLGGDIIELTNNYAFDYVGPLRRSPELAYVGSNKGITSDDRNLYGTFLVGSNYTIYSGKNEYDEKYGLRWLWTPISYLSTSASTAMKVMQRTGASPKLWFAYGTNIAYIPVEKDSNYRYCTTGNITTSYFDADYDTWQKMFYQLWTIAENLVEDAIYITVHYQADTSSSWTALTTISANGVQSVDLTAISCKKIRLKFTLVTNDPTKTPILRLFILRGILQPEVTRTLDMTVVLEQSTSRKVSSDLSFLEGGRTATSPITLKDLRFGTTKYITFLPNSPMELEVIDEATKQPTYQARIVAQQLNWTSP
uniref:Uncharacterized protein n=1 Tax=viral metagenome TaxID=1070528 RepID=A0A6M3JAJ7_9ZZZZ